jgi:iron(III) transport system substrate-binding protein
MRLTLKTLALRAVCLLALAASAAQGAEVNLYTTREPGLIKNLLEDYATRTGVKVNIVFMKDGLAERVASEGAKSPADVLMTVDFANLVDLTAKGVTQPIDSKALVAAVPANLRDPNHHWFALSMRVRTLYTARGGAPQRFTYEELADPKWKGKVCLRSGQHPYNNALIAHLIARNGAASAEAWLRGVKANLARKPGGGDREIARDIMGGLCEIGLGNSYYVGLMRSGKGGPDQQKWGAAIDVVLPVLAQGDGSHANISGAAIAKYAPNRAEAIRFLEFLVSDEAQAIYARANYEYPVKPGVATDPLIAALGALKVDTLSLQEIARYRKAASELVDKVGFDN